MSRSCYTDDYGDEFPGQQELYRANVNRSIRSKAGQARLRELRDALLALPVKELQPEIFVEGTADAQLLDLPKLIAEKLLATGRLPAPQPEEKTDE